MHVHTTRHVVARNTAHACRGLTRHVGMQLLSESVQLALLATALQEAAHVWALCVACALRAALAAAVAAANAALGGLQAAAHADTVLCVAFAVAYASQAAQFFPAHQLPEKLA
jgi:predicted metal-binding protein